VEEERAVRPLLFFFIRFGAGEDLGVGIFFDEILGAFGRGNGLGFRELKKTAVAEIEAYANQHEAGDDGPDEGVPGFAAFGHGNQ
jgi:hypothetical protein